MNKILSDFPKALATFKNGSLIILFDKRPEALDIRIVEKDNHTVIILPVILSSRIINLSPYRFAIIETIISSQEYFCESEDYLYSLKIYFLHLRFINERGLKDKALAQIGEFKRIYTESICLKFNMRHSLNSYLSQQLSILLSNAPTDLLSLCINLELPKYKEFSSDISNNLNQILDANKCVTDNKAIFYFASLPKECYLDFISDLRSDMLVEIRDIFSDFPFSIWYDNTDKILIVKVVKRSKYKEHINIVLNSLDSFLRRNYEITLEKFSIKRLLYRQTNYSIEEALLCDIENYIFKSASNIIENIEAKDRAEAFNQFFKESISRIFFNLGLNQANSIEYFCNNWFANLCVARNITDLKSFQYVLGKIQKRISQKTQYNNIYKKETILISHNEAIIIADNFLEKMEKFLSQHNADNYIGSFFSKGIGKETDRRNIFLLSQVYILCNKLGDHLGLTYSDRIILVKTLD